MAIRITQSQIASTFNSDVQSIYSNMARLQQQVGDGRRITKPSDDPFGTGQVLGFDAQLADLKRYQANTSESIGILNAADSALESVTSALQSIYTKALQGANDPTELAGREALATEIAQYKEVIREAMNTQYGGAHVFGGTATDLPPYPATTNAYGGNNGAMVRRIGDNQTVTVNVPGDTVLGTNPGSALDVIDQLITDLRANNGAAVRASVTSLQAATSKALGVRTQLGATAARLETTQERLDLTEERLLAARTEVADVDTAEAYMKFTQQQTMYQAALAAGTRMLQTSILDFI